MALPASVTFVAANGTTLVAFTTRFVMAQGLNNTLTIYNNAVMPDSGEDGKAWMTTETFTADQYVRATVLRGQNTDTYLEIYARMTAYNNFYWLFLNQNAGEWGRQINGANTTFSGGITYVTGDNFEIRCVGTTLTLFKNGGQISQVTDSSIATGTPGLGGYGFAATDRLGWTLWEADNVGGAPPFSMLPVLHDNWRPTTPRRQM